MGWTFAIPTDGVTNTSFHKAIFDSIRQQAIPGYEILVATEMPSFRYEDQPDVKEIYVEPEKPMWITRKKNACTAAAKYERVCYLHDYIRLDPGWYDGFQHFGDDWDVAMNSVYILDGGARLFDWMLRADLHGFHPLPYDVTHRTNEMYVSGAYWCAKRDFMLKHPLNEDRLWGQDEDGEWSSRIRDVWNLKFNPHSVVRTLKQK